jgi:hypothetical protein
LLPVSGACGVVDCGSEQLLAEYRDAASHPNPCPDIDAGDAQRFRR